MIEIEIKDSYVIDLSQKVWWRPIATAPKDGTQVLLFDPSLTKHKVQLGSYEDIETFSHGKSIRRRQWWAIDGMMMGTVGNDSQPSHWMPVPDEPV